MCFCLTKIVLSFPRRIRNNSHHDKSPFKDPSYLNNGAILKLLFKLFFSLILLSPLVLIGVVIFSLQNESIVQKSPVLGPQDVKRARLIIYNNDPRKLSEGSQKEISIKNNDITLTGNYLLQFLLPSSINSGFQSQINEQQISLLFSLRVPKNPIGSYFNLHIDLTQSGNNLDITKLAFGPFSAPSILTENIVPLFLTLFDDDPYWLLLKSSIQKFKLSDQMLSINYRWRSAWEILARKEISRYNNDSSVTFYSEQLSKLSAKQQNSFEHVISSLFEQAKIKSSTQNPIQENKAVLHTLGSWALGKTLHEQHNLPDFNLKLNGRIDLAKHFLVSAAIASHSNDLLSNLIGTSKELKDADNNSGFSFADLAADRAGTSLGQVITQNKKLAKKAQSILSVPSNARIVLPNILLLPKPMTKQQFVHKYGSTKTAIYKKQLAEIDLKIQESSFFKEINKISP